MEIFKSLTVPVDTENLKAPFLASQSSTQASTHASTHASTQASTQMDIVAVLEDAFRLAATKSEVISLMEKNHLLQMIPMPSPVVAIGI